MDTSFRGVSFIGRSGARPHTRPIFSQDAREPPTHLARAMNNQGTDRLRRMTKRATNSRINLSSVRWATFFFIMRATAARALLTLSPPWMHR